MKWVVVDDYDALSSAAARRLLDRLEEKPETVLGLPTGRTPVGMYARVVRTCGKKDPCFRQVTTFNLDEYVGIPASHPGSYSTFMKQHLFDHIDIDPERIHIPDGLGSRWAGNADSLDERLKLECAAYEVSIADAGALDLTFLGMGQNGHIGFNEPGASFASRTRVIELSESTRRANAEHFRDENVPTRAITIGIATILESHSIVLMASGERKAESVARLATSGPSLDFPASALSTHPDVTVIVDRKAARLLK